MSLVQRITMLCIVLPCLKYVVGNQRICMQLESVGAGIAQGTQGIRQGKMGPRGATGPQGIPGTVDYEQVKEMVRVAVIAETVEMKAIVSSLQTSVQTLKSESETMKANIRALNETKGNTQSCAADEFQYNDNCYWMEIHSARDVSFQEAESICNKRHSTLAYPADKAHYDLIQNKIRLNFPKGNSNALIWLGLRQNPTTGLVTLSSGEAAPYLKWSSAGQPNRVSTYTHVVTVVYIDEENNHNEMWDTYASENQHGVICQNL